MTPEQHPDVPYPFPPFRQPPERKDPLLVPIVYGPAEHVPARRLYERRVVMLSGALDAAEAGDVAAQLMSLDGRSADPIELIVNSPGGPVGEVFAVLDVIDLLRAPVTTTALGRAFGTAAVVLASGTERRRATPNAMLSLRCEETSVSGTAREAEQRVEHERALRERLAAVLAAATRMDRERIDRELDIGAPFDAATALELGIIDVLVESGR